MKENIERELLYALENIDVATALGKASETLRKSREEEHSKLCEDLTPNQLSNIIKLCENAIKQTSFLFNNPDDLEKLSRVIERSRYYYSYTRNEKPIEGAEIVHIAKTYANTIKKILNEKDQMENLLCDIRELRRENERLQNIISKKDKEIEALKLSTMPIEATYSLSIPMGEVKTSVMQYMLANDITRLGDLCARDRKEFVNLRGCGRSTMKQLDGLLKSYSLEWGDKTYIEMKDKIKADKDE